MTRSKTSACPGHDVFARAFMKECTPAETERLVTHVMSCPPCWEKFQAMRRVRTELLTLEAPAEEKWSWSLGLRLAAVLGSALLLLVGLALFVRLDRASTYRGSGPGAGGFALLEPARVLSSPPAVLRCMTVAGADRYEFKIIDEDLQTIMLAGAFEPRLELAEDVRARLVKGRTYIWTVTVTDDASRVVGTASNSFEVR